MGKMAAKFLKNLKQGKSRHCQKWWTGCQKRTGQNFLQKSLKVKSVRSWIKKVTMFPKKWLSRSIIGAIREESSWAISPLHIWATCRLLLLLFLLLLLLSVFDLIFVIVVVIVSALHNTTYKGNSGGKQILRTTRKRRNLNWMLML